jgi:hypothetical protein
MRIRFEPVRVAVNEQSVEGRLVYADDVLVAVLSRVDDTVDETLRDFSQAWVLEAGFGRCGDLAIKTSALFHSLEDVQLRILHCLETRPTITPAD